MSKNINIGIDTSAERSTTFSSPLDIDLIGSHTLIDETLDKIREKMIDRTLESDQMLSRYEEMLKESDSKLKSLKQKRNVMDNLAKLASDKIKINLT